MHSTTLRERALEAHANGKGTVREVARMFGIGVSSFVRWKKRKKATGSPGSTHARGHNPSRVRPEDETLLRELVASNNDWSVEELAVAFVAETGRSCSPSSMGRTLRRLGLTRKKSR